MTWAPKKQWALLFLFLGSGIIYVTHFSQSYINGLVDGARTENQRGGCRPEGKERGNIQEKASGRREKEREEKRHKGLDFGGRLKFR